METLTRLLGTEHGLDDVSRALKQVAQAERPGAVGAVHITCADESERECAVSFQDWFAQDLLPDLKFWVRSPFRIANLGARYEWGAVPIAEAHFATPAARDSFKLLVVKVNAHVSVEASAAGPRYGRMDRYQSESVFCGALHALLEGGDEPFLKDLRDAFTSEGKDRVRTLLDETIVDPSIRSLLAAVVSARLQARRAVLDVQDHRPSSPTLYLVLAGVTLNKKGPDSELVCGVYRVDRRTGETSDTYQGLGDDPADYRLSYGDGRIQLEDSHINLPREARDHRQLVRREFKRPQRDYTRKRDERLETVIQDVKREKHHDKRYAKEILKTLLWILADLSPVPTAALLFAQGLVGIHNVYRAHRMLRGAQGEDDARVILAEIRQKLETMPEDKARELIEVLVQERL